MSPPITLSLHPGRPPVAAYRLAGHALLSDTPLPDLEPFRAPAGAAPPPPPPAAVPAPLVYAADSPLGPYTRHVRVHADAAGHHVAVAGAGRFYVDAQGSAVHRLHADPDGPPDLLTMVIFGPLLTLALAARGVWCLHASAVQRGDRLLVFVGESGRGKSTLAAFLDGRRLADDVLPVSADSHAFPHFPQLKLPAPLDPLPPARLPVSRIYQLAAAPAGADVQIEPLAAAAAAVLLVRHTVAARLFGPGLLTAHLHACTRLAAAVPVCRLRYPHRPSALPAVAAALSADP